MAALTKSQLIDQLTAAHEAYERLAAKHEALAAKCALLTEMVAVADKALSTKRYVHTSAPVDRRAAMQAAKAEAARTGRVVRAW